MNFTSKRNSKAHMGEKTQELVVCKFIEVRSHWIKSAFLLLDVDHRGRYMGKW